MFKITNLRPGVLVLLSTGVILKRSESIIISVDSEALKAELQKLIKENKVHMEEIKEEKKEEGSKEEKKDIVEKKELPVKKSERKWKLK